MTGDPDEHQMYVVGVTDVLVPGLVGHAGGHYESPPQPESDARLLVRVLLALTHTPVGAGPWLRPLAGGRRHVALIRVAGTGRSGCDRKR
jgi:hypothetical protein